MLPPDAIDRPLPLRVFTPSVASPRPGDKTVVQVGGVVRVELGELFPGLGHQPAEVEQQRGPVPPVLDEQRQPGRLAGPLRAAVPAPPERARRDVRDHPAA